MRPSALGHTLSTLRDGVTGFADEVARPAVPLTAATIGIEIGGGLAVITTQRTFRNAEAVPVEAVLTFPVAFDAVVTGLAAEIDGRRLVAEARTKDAARQRYEDAIERGKMAVLHEEVLKGVHVLSVAQLAPGAEVVVTVETVAPLATVGGTPVLRIPTTVGEIYGTSPLMPADDLVTGPEALETARLEVTVDRGRVTLDGHGVLEDAASVRLDRSIILRVEGGTFGKRSGRDAQGRRVRLVLAEAPSSGERLDGAVLFDRSGSTNGRFEGGGDSVWSAMRKGLDKVFRGLGPDDVVALWQFDSACQKLGVARGPAESARLVMKIEGPAGGTELGLAIERMVADGVRDVLVLTDGQTHASEVQEAASRGCRISAVLVGDASLDAGVGHLVAMTGGQLFWAARDDVGSVITQAIGSMRSRGAPVTGDCSNGMPHHVSCVRGGVAIDVTWDGRGRVPAQAGEASDAADVAPGTGEEGSDAIGRFAAALALPLLGMEEATAMAQAHGLCSHVTSLVLVDEASDSRESLPEMRKLNLMASYLDRSHSAAPFPPSVQCYAPSPQHVPIPAVRGSGRRAPLFRLREPWQQPAWMDNVIDWATEGARIATGDISGLHPDILARFTALAAHADVVSLAQALGHDPLLVALALAADAAGHRDRFARRVAERLLRGAPPELLEAAREARDARTSTAPSRKTDFPS
jgi:hypothetical protein